MNNDILENVLSCMLLSDGASNIQRVQTEHRIKLAELWDIKAGSRVLEIGCGQGDTTAVLAYLVGDNGLVHGIDIASPDYGSPITLGDAISHLKQSKLGKQIDIRFEVDVLSPDVDFPDHYFDTIVLSHCSWYLKSFEELSRILEKVKRWGKSLCLAEWDTRIKTMEQFPHFLAVSIQAQYECFKESSFSNIRTLFTPEDLKELAVNAGWKIVKEQSINSTDLQDGGWEVDFTLSEYVSELNELPHAPEKLKAYIQSEVKLLKDASANCSSIQSLSTYTFIAE
ncbi:class I SAM-dependent methyltransferase [Cohnella abietis]|uniref:SAM-dependent methyltransferase n=1 Tax=Cohnella abietis TaxID=2507935 RepID=A0A3T1DBJ8_9BACL|nr:class I SAM-dependent methyltransferase [Cohnella abietis]BBI35472.1 SAM-dependent methyltransferase [Cohnella abietis]